MSALDIPIRLGGALAIIEVAQAATTRALKAGSMTQPTADRLNREFAALKPLVLQDYMHSSEELRHISEKIAVILELTDTLTHFIPTEEWAKLSDGKERFSGRFLKKLRAK